MSLYEEIVEAQIPIDSHESDLYFLKTKKSMEILKKYFVHAKSAAMFKSDIDGKQWVDVPFAYLPWWENRTARYEPFKDRRIK